MAATGPNMQSILGPRCGGACQVAANPEDAGDVRRGLPCSWIERLVGAKAVRGFASYTRRYVLT